MSVKWTEEQQKVIDLRNRNILVSAAAGSGKTAVLVERIIRRLTDEKDPADVDRLLIVTFTEAAAAEMKERIGAAIEKELLRRPEDAHLERQATLIHSASITTIHSFCLSVIRDHFHVIDIDPGFRIAEEGELKLLKQDVLDELLEECYAEGSESFHELVEKFGTGRNDRKLEGIILKLYEYSRSYPQPDKWLDSCADAYDITEENAAGHPAVERAVQRIRRRAEDILGIQNEMMKIIEQPDGPYMYGDMVESDMEGISKIAEARDFQEMYERTAALVWKRLSAKKDDSVSQEKKELVKKQRDQVKKLVKEMQSTYFFAPAKEWIRDMKESRPVMEALTGLVKRFAMMFSEKKRSGNMIDFNDMEQFALAILTEEKDGEMRPSPVAAEYQERFDEVMIDEYQDSNLVQEAILTSVSRTASGVYNVFMVGDVKQSIYRFRLSRPELFMEKYDTYSLTDSKKQRIDLHKNFRSRAEVLDSVNDIFRRIMRKELGGIEYDDSAALYPGASYPEMEKEGAGAFTDRTELLLLDKKETAGEDERKAEARMIACRIRELMQGGRVTDKESGKFRNVQYKDIVILTRSIRGWAESFSSVLAEEGIPAYSVSREGYFETYEVSVLLDYLKILDNARQDLPLAAVLTSPFAGLSSQEMAEIRLAFPNRTFYEAAAGYAREEKAEEEGAELDGRLREKLAAFFRQAEQFRQMVPYTAIHDLLAVILEETGYGISIAAMPGGSQRTANLEMLSEKAAAFEGTSYKGLFNFVRYIEQLKKYDVDYGEASILDEQADTVRIMSIHKSKGLEFPIVFAAGMGKTFNTQDSRGSIVLHPEWGVGVDVIDLKKRTRTPSFLKKIIQEEAALENLAEEQRILYVAMTRAKEKLILSGVCEFEKALESEGDEGGRISLYRLEKARSYLDWIIPAVLEGGGFREETVPGTQNREDVPVDVRIFTEEELGFKEAVHDQADVVAGDVLYNWDAGREYAPLLKKRLEEQMDYVYPYEDEGKMKLKFTVSELKKRSVLAEEAGEEMYTEPEVVPLIPEFLKEEETLSGASRGSAYHKLLELLDFARGYDRESLMAEVEKFKEEGRLTRDMAECIRPEDILHFLQCRSGQRMAKAAGKGKLYKEQPFVLGVDASEIYPGEKSGEIILVQGIIDVYFEEEDGLVVLDYKTDRVKTGKELAEKYHAQLDYYAQALEQLLQRPVKEKIIYSFTLEEEISV